MSDAAQPSAFAPLKRRLFAVLWTATVVGNVGLWMRDTASSWLMTELAPSPLMVALVQAAGTLPIFLLSLPAGALSDIVDRRRMMIAVQVGLGLVSLALAVLTALGLISPVSLLLLTLCGGIGSALSGPVWQSIVPELVPRAELKPAVALNSLGINISRAIGPALGGALIVSSGVAMAYAVDVLTYAVTIAALVWWRRDLAPPSDPEHLGAAMRSGVRYALRSAPLRRVLLRAFLFFLPASCYWALLPLIARQEIGGGASGYGILLSAMGAGAIAGALIMPRLRARFDTDSIAMGATALTGLATMALAAASTVILGAAILAVAGAAWITVLTTLNATAQAVLPNWVRGRGLAIYLTVFFGTMTLGSVVWGQGAGYVSLDGALLAAGLLSLAGAGLARLLPLPAGEDDLSPSHHWPEPLVAEPVDRAGGPIMVTITYEVARADHAAFSAAAAELRDIRLRDGAYAWGLMSDAVAPETIVEWFLVASWADHLRQHERVSLADKAVQQRVGAFHRGPQPPAVRHLVPVGATVPREAADHLGHEPG